jgi:MYXO-CTERM domain-containing protein
MVGTWILLAAAQAATLTVGPSGDYASVEAALEEAEDGDEISIAAGEYSGALDIEVDVSLVGADPAAPPVLTARGDVITIGGNVVLLESLVVVADGGRGITADAGTDLTLRSSQVRGAAIDEDGGALRLVDGVLLVENSSFIGNAADDGGHLYLDRSDVTLRDSTFVDGEARFGGAVRVANSEVLVEDCVFTDNTVDRDGGALYVLGSDVVIRRAELAGNSTRALECGDSCEAGGARFGDGSTWTIEDSVFDRNIAADDIGGALVSTARSTGTLVGTTFSRNIGTFGGAIYVGSEGGLTVSGCVFDGNVAEAGEGGAIRWRPDAGEPTLSIVTSVFVNNTAADAGGALGLNTSNGDRGALLLEDNRFELNSSDTLGGAVHIAATARVLGVRNHFCGNTASSSGGALRIVEGGGEANDWRNNIFLDNTAAEFGGGVHLNQVGTTRFTNNHVLGNGAADGGGVRVFDSTVEFVNNLVGWSTSGAGLSAEALAGELAYSDLFDNAPEDLGGALTPDAFGDGVLSVDPELRAYVPGGGCDQAVYPLESSPLIDAGDPSILDADGGPSDIGAFGGPDAPEGAAVDNDGDGYVALEDCDDNDPTVFPGAEETCDGVDQDCDGLIDVGAVDGGTFYLDVDRDGEGDPATEVEACDAPAGHVSTPGDCDDTNASIFPGALEVCDGLDQDCNGVADDGLLEVWFSDADGDGFGDAEVSEEDCRAPVGFVADDTDCDDGDGFSYPGAPDELGDQVDQDCDGEDGSLTPEGGKKPSDGCGCASSGPATGWLWLFAVAGLLGRRRH